MVFYFFIVVGLVYQVKYKTYNFQNLQNRVFPSFYLIFVITPLKNLKRSLHLQPRLLKKLPFITPKSCFFALHLQLKEYSIVFKVTNKYARNLFVLALHLQLKNIYCSSKISKSPFFSPLLIFAPNILKSPPLWETLLQNKTSLINVKQYLCLAQKLQQYEVYSTQHVLIIVYLSLIIVYV